MRPKLSLNVLKLDCSLFLIAEISTIALEIIFLFLFFFLEKEVRTSDSDVVVYVFDSVLVCGFHFLLLSIRVPQARSSCR